MKYTAAVITMSDKGAVGQREDTSGENLVKMLTENQWDVVYRNIIPDDREEIIKELKLCADEKEVCLVVTTGGTGFSKRDITPEATKEVIERECPGICEAMRAESLRITPMGMLSREVSGIRKETLIINLPGSKKASAECLGAVIGPVRHGVDILKGWSHDCAEMHKHDHAHDHGHHHHK